MHRVVYTYIELEQSDSRKKNIGVPVFRHEDYKSIRLCKVILHLSLNIYNGIKVQVNSTNSSHMKSVIYRYTRILHVSFYSLVILYRELRLS